MPSISESGTFKLGHRLVRRLGYGAMQLAGPGVFGPPKDHAAALAVLREAVASGVNHIDTSDFYGPHVTNRIIRRNATPLAVALAWLLQRSPNILLIPGTSSVAHLRENLGSAALTLTENDLRELNGIGAS